MCATCCVPPWGQGTGRLTRQRDRTGTSHKRHDAGYPNLRASFASWDQLSSAAAGLPLRLGQRRRWPRRSTRPVMGMHQLVRRRPRSARIWIVSWPARLSGRARGGGRSPVSGGRDARGTCRRAEWVFVALAVFGRDGTFEPSPIRSSVSKPGACDATLTATMSMPARGTPFASPSRKATTSRISNGTRRRRRRRPPKTPNAKPGAGRLSGQRAQHWRPTRRIVLCGRRAAGDQHLGRPARRRAPRGGRRAVALVRRPIDAGGGGPRSGRYRPALRDAQRRRGRPLPCFRRDPGARSPT